MGSDLRIMGTIEPFRKLNHPHYSFALSIAFPADPFLLPYI
jgi:hypothetical protein